MPFRTALVEENGCEQDERAVSGTMSAEPPLTSRKTTDSVSGREEAFSSNVGSFIFCKLQETQFATSPQCQPTTDRKEKDLDRIERTLYTCYTVITGKNRR